MALSVVPAAGPEGATLLGEATSGGAESERTGTEAGPPDVAHETVTTQNTHGKNRTRISIE